MGWKLRVAVISRERRTDFSRGLKLDKGASGRMSEALWRHGWRANAVESPSISSEDRHTVTLILGRSPFIDRRSP